MRSRQCAGRHAGAARRVCVQQWAAGVVTHWPLPLLESLQSLLLKRSWVPFFRIFGEAYGSARHRRQLVRVGYTSGSRTAAKAAAEEERNVKGSDGERN